MAHSFQAKIAARGYHIYKNFLKEENGKVDCCVYSTKHQPSAVHVRGLEIPLNLESKSPNFITHQKIKGFMKNLYLYDYKVKAETDEDDDGEFHFLIANQVLDGDKE